MQDIIESTQYGDLERCKQYLSQGYDVNQRDSDDVTLLHWAALNGRLDVARLYVDNGAIVNVFGGIGQDTPLHWAAQKGHLSMVVLLMKNGANPTLRDGAGCAVIHRAAQESHTAIVAYLLAKGISPNIQDRSGMTSLMWSACWNEGLEISKLLLSFGANASIQDKFLNNTALHWAIYAKKPKAIALLIKSKASLDICNFAGETPYTLLKKMEMEHNEKDKWKKTIPRFLQKAVQNKKLQKLKFGITAVLPFLMIYALGSIFSADLEWIWKLVLDLSVFLIAKFVFKYTSDTLVPIAMNVYFVLGIKAWVYIVWFMFIGPVVSLLYTAIFTVSSGFLFYFFIRFWKRDPGFIVIPEDERNKTIIELAEEDGINPKKFCTTCLVKKPLLSKHCYYCDRCVARFDHHCYWLSNCVGWKNHKAYLGYLFFVVFMSIIFASGTWNFWNLKLGEDWQLFDAFAYQSWVNFMMLLTVVHGVWVGTILFRQLYQILCLGWASKQRLNLSRRTHFEMGRSTRNVVEKSVRQNFVDFFEINYWSLKPDETDWMREWPPKIVQKDKWEW